MEDPEEFETGGDEPWPCRIHNPAPHLVCTVQSATQITTNHSGNESGHMKLSKTNLSLIQGGFIGLSLTAVQCPRPSVQL